MTKKEFDAGTLAQFTGSEQWYRHGIARNVLYTDGVQYLAEHAGAYWLIDEIAFAQVSPRLCGEEFQHWRLKVDPDKHGAMLTADDGNGKALFEKAIPYTDFPLPEISLYFENGTILLPDEH